MSTGTRREKIEQMLEQQPDDVFLLYGLAMEYVREGDEEEGIRRLQRVTEVDPDYHSAYFQGGQILARQGESEQAREWVSKGIEAARRKGNSHAAGEMEGFLLTL